jgi:hypothetical protein
VRSILGMFQVRVVISGAPSRCSRYSHGSIRAIATQQLVSLLFIVWPGTGAVLAAKPSAIVGNLADYTAPFVGYRGHIANVFAALTADFPSVRGSNRLAREVYGLVRSAKAGHHRIHIATRIRL